MFHRHIFDIIFFIFQVTDFMSTSPPSVAPLGPSTTITAVKGQPLDDKTNTIPGSTNGPQVVQSGASINAGGSIVQLPTSPALTIIDGRTKKSKSGFPILNKDKSK